MSKQDRQKLSVLLVLLGVLAVTMVLAYRMNQPQTTAALQTAEAKTPANPPPQNDAARIRLDLVEKSDDSDGIAKRNLFQYQQTPPPPAFSGRSASSPGSLSAAPPPPPPAPIPIRPQGPPPPPPINLKYQGFATTTTPNQGYTAFIGDDSRHYNVTVGEILMGRFRIAAITDKAVEIEDLEYNRRQILPLLK
jgi:hypothetical protein